MDKPPSYYALALLEVAVTPNGEVLFLGKTIGWVDKIGKYLTLKTKDN